LPPPAIPTRKAARYPFAAGVSIHEPGSGARTSGLTTDLSAGGCCVRVAELFSRGIHVELELVKEGESIRIPATVAYALPPNVMGLSFGEIADGQQRILARWIEQAIPTLRRLSTEKQSPSSQQVAVPLSSAQTKEPST
jgi:hypothetical protein